MKLESFYRVLPGFPTPLQLIFQDSDGLSYFQNIDREQRISGFTRVLSLDDQRTIISGEHMIDAEVGELGIYAVAMSKDHVIVGHTGSVQSSLGQYITSHESEIRPFDLLEFAMFMKDTQLILKAAQACKSHLEAVAPALVARWIDGSPLDTDVRARLRISGDQKPGAMPRLEPITARIGFAGPYALMRALTIFSETHGLTRAAIVRSMFQSDDVAGIIDSLIPSIDKTISALNIYLSRLNYERKFNSMPSRGAVWVRIADRDGYFNVRRTFSQAMYESELYVAYRRLPFISIGKETLNFIMVSSFFIYRFSDFEDFLLHNAEQKPPHSLES